MHKIQVNGKVYIFLDHRKLINEAYNPTGLQEYVLLPELFEFHRKDSRNGDEVKETSRKKRKRHKTLKDAEANITDKETLLDELSQATAAIKDFFYLLPPKLQLDPMTRFWEQLSSDDFPKFKGANSTSSFQIIHKLVKEVSFVVPPHCSFYNNDVAELGKYIAEFPAPFDLIVLDPPWRNKYIRRLKRHQLGYSMLESKQLKEIPIQKLIHECSVVSIWCTNSKQHQETLLEQLFPSWGLRLLHTIKWLKLNTQGEPIGTSKSCSEEGGKQPFEMLYIACHSNAETDFGAGLKEVELLMSVPSIIHSHKPPLLELIRKYFPMGESPKCFEVFARYLQPNFTSFGLEVLKLMDRRLYSSNDKTSEERDD